MKREIVKRTHEQINKVEEEIGKLESLGNTQSMTRYITLLLKKVSIYNAEALYYYTNSYDIPSVLIDKHLEELTNVLNFILNKAVHPANSLTLPEINENFKVWSEISRATLYDFIVKTFFASSCLVKYFAKDKRWAMVLGDTCYKLSRCSLNLLDIAVYQQQDALQNKDTAVVTKTLNLIINIHEWSAEECLKIYTVNKRNQHWCFRVINLMHTTSLLYLLKQDMGKRKSCLDRIEIMLKRLTEDQKKLRGPAETAQEISTMPLEKLLKIDRNFSK